MICSKKLKKPRNSTQTLVFPIVFPLYLKSEAGHHKEGKKGNVMEHSKRFIFVVSLFVISMIVIHTTRAPQRISMEVQTVCFPTPLAKKLSTDSALKWDAQIAYDTVEKDDQKIPSYRCYVSFPKVDVVCTPKSVAERKDLQSCPAFPSLLGAQRTCYFLNKKQHSFTQKFSQQPRMSMKDLNGVVVKTIPEAKKILMRKK